MTRTRPPSPNESAATLTRRLRIGETSALEIVVASLQRSGQGSVADRCFIRRLDNEASAEARRVDQAIALGERVGVLGGVPIAIKDNIAVAGVTTTAGSAALADGQEASRDATVVHRLRDSHAIVVGTTNLNELAYGFTGENDWFGQVPNPWDERRVSGGSSSGSAAAVAAGIVPIAVGTDTNGSVRVPAALCGVRGLRPTTGSVPTDGIVPLAETLDVAGLLAATAADFEVAAQVLSAGCDDTASVHATAPPRVRAVAGFPADWACSEVQEAVDRVAQFLGARPDFYIPRATSTRAAAQILTAVEAAAAHSMLLSDRQDRLGRQTRTRLLAGALVPARLYVRATTERSRARQELLAAMTDTDILVTPATPCPAPAIGAEIIELQGVSEPVNATLGRCTTPFSLVGFPALTIPIPDLGPLPVGVQLVARPGDDARLLDIARELEAADVASAKTS